MNTALTVLRRRRGPIQFGLRGMFMATTILAVWLGAWLHRARQQDAAAHAVMAQGGKVFYELRAGSAVPAPASWLRWLARTMGQHDDFCRDVREVELDQHSDDSVFAHVAQFKCLECLHMPFGARRVTDSGVVQLRSLTCLSDVVLQDSQITDESLRTLGARPALTSLFLRGARVSDTGLACLQGSSKLRFLSLSGDGVRLTDHGMRSLSRLRELEWLAIEDASITFRGLDYLYGLTKLVTLRLSNNSGIGDEGLRRIAHLTALEELVVSSTNVTSKGLEHLKRLRKLRRLDLSGNRGITDEGMACLAQLVNLQELNLHNTAVSSRGIEHLTRLTKLVNLDLSENGAITDGVMRHLGKLSALTVLDLHKTRAVGGNDGTWKNLPYLGGLSSLILLDLAATGADTGAIRAALPRCRVVGSRETDSRPRADKGENYRHIRAEIISIGYDLPRGTNSVARLLTHAERELFRHMELERTLDRMLAVCKVEGIDPAFAQQSPLVEAFLRRLNELPCAGGRGAGTTFKELLLAAQSNVWLRRLYAGASDLVFADALRAHLDYLDDIKAHWAPTDVELEQSREAPGLLRVCLHDASAQLGFRLESSTDEPLDGIVAIWKQTRAPAATQRYAGYWDGDF